MRVATENELVQPVSANRSKILSDCFNYEPAFIVPEFSALTDLSDVRGKNAAYLSHCVSRNPQDLKSHVQRISLHLNLQNADAAWGALIDVFLVLQANGKALKQRLLDSAHKLLGDRRHMFLHGRLESGLSSKDRSPESIHSVLSAGSIESLQLIGRADGNSIQARDPLTEAQEYLEYGQIEEAQTILQAAIRREPSRAELHYELLTIYRGTRDEDAFASMHGSLVPGENPVPEAWIELARYLAERGQDDGR